MKEAQQRILNLISKNVISPDEGLKLLDAIKTNSTSKIDFKGKNFNVQIKNKMRDEEILDIVLPISIAKLILKFIPSKFIVNIKLGNSKVKLESIPWSDILATAVSEEKGDLFHLDFTENDGTTTEIDIFID